MTEKMFPETVISEAIRKGLVKQLLRDGKITERVADDLLRTMK